MKQTQHAGWIGARMLRLGGAAALIGLIAVPRAFAFEFDTGDQDLKIRWDNTLKYSAGWRLLPQSKTLISNPNLDDGDRAFKQGGMILNRGDLLSEFDAGYKGFGVRVSGMAWYDQVYNEKNANTSPGTVNHFTTAYNEFADNTTDLLGKRVELGDAFTYGKFRIGGVNATYRIGQHAVFWGETLFFGANGVAGAMAPFDVAKALSVPGTQFKELVRPVPQVSTLFQLTPTVSVGAFYQVAWDKDRLPPSGSYFSFVDILGDGSQLLVGPGFTRTSDMNAKGQGQGGVELRVRSEQIDTDFGLYALNWHSKDPQLYIYPVPVAGYPNGRFQWVYPENIQTYAVSASKTLFDNYNFATEWGIRRNTPLNNDAAIILPGMAADNDKNARYGVGNSVHGNLSWLASLEPSFIANEASFLGEFAWNHLLNVTKNKYAGVLDPNNDKNAETVRMIYEPGYRQVLPGLDITIPLGISYTIGRSAVLGPGFGVNHGGDMDIGMTFTYLQVWKGTLNYTHYYGKTGGFLNAAGNNTFQQDFADRDFATLSIARTF